MTAGRRRGIAVVIPTLGRPWAVRRLLDSLMRSAGMLPADVPADVIVVDDSDGEDAARIERHCHEVGARYIRGPKNVGAKRNAGVAATSQELVLFVDSDCVASPDLLRLHVERHATGRSVSGRATGAVAGPALMEGQAATWAWRACEASRLANAPFQWPLEYDEMEWAATCNLSVPRRAFEEVGGFDEATYTVVGGEDVDFGVRLYGAGYTTVSAPDAVVTHDRDSITTVAQFHRKLFTYGRACVYNCHRQPEKADRFANPLALAAGAAFAGLVIRRPWWWGLWAAAVGVAFARQVRDRVADGRHGVVAAALGTTIDLSFDLGILVESLRRGRPGSVFTWYRYVDSTRFWARQDVSESEPEPRDSS